MIDQAPAPEAFDSYSLRDDPVIIRVNEFNDQTAGSFQEDLSSAQETGQPIVPVVISSWGGKVSAAIQMHSAIQRSSLPVLTYTPDRAMSAGFALLSFGTEGYRFVDPEAFTMDHQAKYGVIGKDAEVENQMEQRRREMDQFYRLLDKQCGKDPGYFKERWSDMNNLNDYLDAEGTVEIGAADHIGRPEITLEAEANWNIDW